MVKIAADVPPEMVAQIDRIVRDGWFPDQESVFKEALGQFVEARSFLGDSPRLLHRFAADALNESKPETGLKFVDRALSLINNHQMADLSLYQNLIELRVQILMVMGKNGEAIRTLEDAREKLPNSPTILKWLEKLRGRKV